MRFNSLLFALLASAVSSHAALVAGPDRPVSAAALGGAHGYHRPHALATDGTDFLSVWSDETEGRDGIYATIVTESGATRPVAPLPLVRGYATAQAVWTGDAYLVLIGQRNGGGTIALRLNRDAQVISQRTQILPDEWGILDLAWNGRRALAIVNAIDGRRRVMLLDGHGQVVRADVTLPSTVRPYFMTAAAAGDAFIVAWTEELEPQQGPTPPLTVARAVQISAEGVTGSPIELLPPTRGYAGIDAASGRNEAAVIISTNDTVKRQLRRLTISGATATVKAEPVLDLEPFSGYEQVVHTPAGFVVSYLAIRENVQAVLLGSIPFDSDTNHVVTLTNVSYSELKVVSNGPTVMAVWGGFPLRGAALSSDLRLRKTDVVTLAIAVTRQTSPRIASAGNMALYVWIDEELAPELGVIKVRRFDAAGNPLDAQPLALGKGARPRVPPEVAFTGKVWMVTWHSGSGIFSRVHVQRVSPDGVLLDAAPIDLGVGVEPVIASNGTSAAVVIAHARRQGMTLVRFSPEGTRLDSTPLIVTASRADKPAIGTNGQEYLVTWTEHPAPPYLTPNLPGVFGARLSADATLLDTAPIAIANGPLDETDSYVASNGTDFVVAYVAYEPPLIVDPPLEEQPETVFTVYTKRVLRNGALTDVTADQDGRRLGEGVDPAIAAIGGRFIATFVRHDVSHERPDVLTILAVPLDARGEPAAPVRTLVEAESYSQVHALATVGGSVWLAYARVEASLGGVQRVFARELKEEPVRRRIVRR